FNIAYGASFENQDINHNIDKENINKQHNGSEYNGGNDNMIINAAKLAYAHNFVINLPEGYDTLVDESGLRLSGGEKQRILMARAFLKNAPILILDEATASLDNESERHIQEALFNLCRDKIAIVIAHRLSTVKKADNIYVIENGEIVEQGNHEKLIELDGIYKNLLIKQMQ
ncbi:MAG: ATP-binding cassette domain-containing protein, partial [bacterium]